MNRENIIIVFCMAFLVIYAISTYTKYRYTRKAQEIALQNLYLHLTIDSSISEKLDNFIEECFNDYILLNTEYRKDIYWTEAEEVKMVNEVGELVSKRISPIMLRQINVYYSMESIPDIIGNKVYELVIAYLNLKTNTSKEPDRA